MPNNQLLASDNFASGSLAAGWSAIQGFSTSKVVGSGASAVTEPNTAAVTAGQYWNAATPNDQTSELTLGAGWTSSTSTYALPCVRMQSGAYSGYIANIGDGSATAVAIYVVTAGVNTILGAQITGLTIAAGDVWTLQAAGAVISLYQNGERVGYRQDTTYTSGFSGYLQYDSAAITRTQVSSWRGYSAVQQSGVWTKQGIVVPAIAGDLASSGYGTYQPSIIKDTNAQILSGTVCKMWFSGGGTSANIYYAESTDGNNWIRYGSAVLASYSNGQVVKVGSTYHMFAQPSGSQGSGTIARFTSSDGLSWSLADASVLGAGGAGAWDQTGFYVLAQPVLFNGTWYMFYCGLASGGNGLFKTGVATASAITGPWTKSGGNPLISNAVPATPVQVGNTWYMWTAGGPAGFLQQSGTGNDNYEPIGNRRWQSTDLLTWINPVSSIQHSQIFEDVNGIVGGIAACQVIDIGTPPKAFLYSISSPNDNGAPQDYQIAVATAPVSIASLVTQNEDAASQVATDSFTSGIGDLSANWATPTGDTKLQIIAGNLVEASAINTTCAMRYVGASFNNDHYSDVTVQAVGDSYVQPCVRCQSVNTYYTVNIFGTLGTRNSTAFQVFKIVAGASTAVGPVTPYTPNAGDVFRLAVTTGSDGNPILSVYQNGFLMLQVEDYSNAIPSGGAPGMAIYSATLTHGQISAWAGGNANVIPTYIVPPASAGSSFGFRFRFKLGF